MIVKNITVKNATFKDAIIVSIAGTKLRFENCDFSKCIYLKSHLVTLDKAQGPIDMGNWDVYELIIEDAVEIKDFGNVKELNLGYVDHSLLDAIEKSKITEIDFCDRTINDFGYFRLHKQFDSVIVEMSSARLPRFNTKWLLIFNSSDITVDYDVPELQIKDSGEIRINAHVKKLDCEYSNILGNVVVDYFNGYHSSVDGRVYAHEVSFTNDAVVNSTVVIVAQKSDIGPNTQIIGRCKDVLPGFRRHDNGLKRL